MVKFRKAIKSLSINREHKTERGKLKQRNDEHMENKEVKVSELQEFYFFLQSELGAAKLMAFRSSMEDHNDHLVLPKILRKQ